MKNSSNNPLYLIDTSIYVFRAWFALPDTLQDTDGKPANAVYGFCDFTLRLLREANPQQIVFAFDESLETSYRNEIYPPYKAHREVAPEELKAQFVHCRELLTAGGISEIASGHYEADDLIGTLTHQAHQRGQPVVIVSGDKDLTQLLEDGDLWWDYTRGIKLDYNGVCDKFGVKPEQMSDFLAITGDRVDNVPGVPGVGPKTAAALISHFGSVEQLLNKVGQIAELPIRGAKRIEGLVREYGETIRLAHKLTTIFHDISMPEGFTTRIGLADYDRLETLFELLGFGPYRRRQWENCLTTLATI